MHPFGLNTVSLSYERCHTSVFPNLYQAFVRNRGMMISMCTANRLSERYILEWHKEENMNIGRNQLKACIIGGLLFSAIKMFSAVFVFLNPTEFAFAHVHPDIRKTLNINFLGHQDSV